MMLPLGWQDRVLHKQNLSKWLDIGAPVFAISVNDSQEIDDIEEWLRGKFEGGFITNAICTSDTEILKYEFLETMVYGLGEDKFKEFIKETQKTPILPPVSVAQSVGNDAKAKNEIEYENIYQNANIFMDSTLLQKQYYFEKNIFPLLVAFTKDVQNLAKKNKTLLIIKFRKIEYEDKDIGSDFLVWLQEQFLSRMIPIKNLRVCIIFQGNINRLTKINDGQKLHLKSLNLQDILEATKEYFGGYEEFCNGVIDPDDNTVEYTVFKRKFHARMRKLIQEKQNG